jgi:hypothetical protein
MGVRKKFSGGGGRGGDKQIIFAFRRPSAPSPLAPPPCGRPWPKDTFNITTDVSTNKKFKNLINFRDSPEQFLNPQ